MSHCMSSYNKCVNFFYQLRARTLKKLDTEKIEHWAKLIVDITIVRDSFFTHELYLNVTIAFI